MTDKISTKSFIYGAEHEASWPPRFPEEPRGVVMYYDKEKGKMVEGYPPCKINRHGVAPMVLFDSMPETYHEGVCRKISSRQEWELADKQSGKLTFGSMEEPRRYVKKGISEEDKALKADRRQAAKAAIEAYNSNPKEVSQKLQKEAEKQRKVLERAVMTQELKKAIRKI